MGDTGAMKRPSRLRQPRILRRDWIGDAVLTLVCGVVLLVSVFLPWVNEDGPGWVNFSLDQGGGLNGVLDTQWGVPALVLALAVVAIGLVMVAHAAAPLLDPASACSSRRCGVAAFGVAQDAAAHIGWNDPGVGMYLTTLVAVLLVPIGLAAALVAWILGARGASSGAPPPPAYSPASSRKRSTELIGTPSSSAMRNLAIIAFGSPGCRLEWSRIRPRPFSPRICSIA